MVEVSEAYMSELYLVGNTVRKVLVCAEKGTVYTLEVLSPSLEWTGKGTAYERERV